MRRFLAISIPFILSNHQWILIHSSSSLPVTSKNTSRSLSNNDSTAARNSSSGGGGTTTTSSSSTLMSDTSIPHKKGQEDNASLLTSSSSSQTSNLIHCKPAPQSQCELCVGTMSDAEEETTESSPAIMESCQSTGKHQLFVCQSLENEDDDNFDVKVYKSCHRTKWDEDYLMLRFQGLCMLLAFLSLRSVKREKIMSESLFDQRKRRMAQGAGNPSVGNRSDMDKRRKQEMYHQEMVPLRDTVGQESFEEDNEDGNDDDDEEIGFGTGFDDIQEEDEGLD